MALSPAQSSFINHLVLMEFEKDMDSEAAFLKIIKIPPTTASKWKKLPAFVAALIAAKHAFVASPDYLSTCLNHKALLELEKEYKGAKKGDSEKRQYLRMILDRTDGAAKASQAPVSFRHLSDASLIEAMTGADMLPEEAADAIEKATEEGETDGTLLRDSRGDGVRAGDVSRMVPKKRPGGGDGRALSRGSLKVR